MKRTAILLAVLMIVPYIAFGNEQTARPRTRTNPIIETQKFLGISAGAEETADRRTQATADVKTIKISDNRAGNKRFPGVCENAKGDRLVIYRGPNNLYWYSFARKEASWSAPKVIPDQPKLKAYTCTDVEVDSTGRFHCVWEEPNAANVYASFLDGHWTKPFKLDMVGKYNMGTSLAVRSNDQVIIANGQSIRAGYLTKDIFFYFKDKDDSKFTSKNVTNDTDASAMPVIAVDANDHIWMAIKDEVTVSTPEILDTCLFQFDQNNDFVDWKILSEEKGWCFWPQIAVNSEGKIMATWAHVQSNNCWSRIYDPNTKTLGGIKSVGIGIPRRPWCTFWSKLAAHGKDFYLAAMDSGRLLHLMKFNEEASRWERVADISSGPVYYFDLYSGYDKMLIAWDNYGDPSNIYLTTVAVTPAGPRLSKISGKVQQDSKGVSGVTLTGLPGNPTTDRSGNYSAEVENGWTGTVIPNKSGYRFLPSSREYVNVTSAQEGQDYKAIGFSKISGKVQQDSKGVSGVTLTGLPGNPTTDRSGIYSTDVENGWMGTVIPNKSGYRFLPSSREYINVTSAQAEQNYRAIKQFNLTITATSGGTTAPQPATYPKDMNSRVTVRGNPDSNYRFDKWTGDASGSSNPMTLTIDRDKTIRANFIKQFNLTITATSGGTTTPPPATYPYDLNSSVTVTAIPDLNYRFDKWEVDGVASGSVNPMTLPIDKSKTIRANFIRIKSAANLKVEKRVERGFFSGYTLNALTWEANPENAEMGLTVSAQRVYRKARAEDKTKWARIVELTGTVLKYDDRNVPSDSDYVYAVTCVDDMGNESAIY